MCFMMFPSFGGSYARSFWVSRTSSLDGSGIWDTNLEVERVEQWDLAPARPQHREFLNARMVGVFHSVDHTFLLGSWPCNISRRPKHVGTFWAPDFPWFSVILCEIHQQLCGLVWRTTWNRGKLAEHWLKVRESENHEWDSKTTGVYIYINNTYIHTIYIIIQKINWWFAQDFLAWLSSATIPVICLDLEDSIGWEHMKAVYLRFVMVLRFHHSAVIP